MRGFGNKLLIVTVALLVMPIIVSAENSEWKEIKTKDGIAVYKRDVENSAFKMYKATMVVNQPMEVLFEVLLDVPGYTEWMPDISEASVVKWLDKDRIMGNLVVHIVFDAMWPVKNREVVVKALSKIDWDKGRVIITLRDTDEYSVPLRNGRKAVEKFYAVFDFKYIDRQHTSVTYLTHADPGGAVPAGIASIQTAGIPYKTLKGLVKMAEKPIYYKQAMRDYF